MFWWHCHDSVTVATEPEATKPVGCTVHEMRKLLVVFTSLLFATGTIGTNIGPALVDEYPELILALSSRSRNLFGAVPFIDPLPYFAIGFVRLLAAAFALFFVGRLFGEKALNWAESQVGEMPRIYRITEKFAMRFGWLAVFLMPGSNIVCLLVGHLKMKTRTFAIAIVGGIMLRLVVLWYGGKAFEDQIRSALDWIDQYQWWIVGILFGISFLQTSRKRSPRAPQP
jgi:membrane protein DedA with SNARE-associated domain